MQLSLPADHRFYSFSFRGPVQGTAHFISQRLSQCILQVLLCADEYQVLDERGMIHKTLRLQYAQNRQVLGANTHAKCRSALFAAIKALPADVDDESKRWTKEQQQEMAITIAARIIGALNNDRKTVPALALAIRALHECTSVIEGLFEAIVDKRKRRL